MKIRKVILKGKRTVGGQTWYGGYDDSMQDVPIDSKLEIAAYVEPEKKPSDMPASGRWTATTTA